LRSKVIIGIHGLGNKPEKLLLEKWWTLSLQEGLSKIGFDGKFPDFKLVYWSDVLYAKPLDSSISDYNSPLYLDEPYKPSDWTGVKPTYKYRKKIVDIAKKGLDKVFLKKDFSSNYSFISKALIHNYFKDLATYYDGNFDDKASEANKVRANIRKRLYDTLKFHSKKEILLIAHSMGSIVAFDVLTLMVSDFSIDTFITIGSPLGLPLVKSNIARETNNYRQGLTKLPVPACVRNNWYNFADLEDSVALHYDITDDYSANESGVVIKDFLITNDYVGEKGRSSHNCFGYLRTPELSKVVLEFINRKKKPWYQKIFNWLKLNQL
jgi:hypothetical protein